MGHDLTQRSELLELQACGVKPYSTIRVIESSRRLAGGSYRGIDNPSHSGDMGQVSAALSSSEEDTGGANNSKRHLIGGHEPIDLDYAQSLIGDEFMPGHRSGSPSSSIDGRNNSGGGKQEKTLSMDHNSSPPLRI